MGSFFTNVQVSTGGRTIDEIHAAIVAALRQRARETGLEEDETLSDEEAERTIMVAPPGPEPWITVYDEITEDQDPDTRRDLGEALSRVGGAAITVLVHDSDILEMRLCQNGAQVDVYNSYPNYFVQDPNKTREPPVGNAALWGTVLAPGATPEALRAAWEVRETFAEWALPRIAVLLGWNREWCAEGFRYLADVADDLTGFTRLAFRPSAETAHGRPPLFADGPPRFEQGTWSPELRVEVGGSETAHVSFRSVGGAGQGIQSVIWGLRLMRSSSSHARPSSTSASCRSRTSTVTCRRR